MDTFAISYRVADFLKKHPPFHAIEDPDLLELSARGRVRFHEPNEYILWQGEPHRHHVFVIQHGTVSLWDEAGQVAELRDVRGAGDMLGTERYNDARSCLHSARSDSDVVIYAFPAEDFESFVLKYPHAAQYVTAESRVSVDYQPVAGRRGVHQMFLHDLVAPAPPPTCRPDDRICDAARRLLTDRRDALAVVDPDGRPRAIVTPDTLLAWLASGGGDARQRVETLPSRAPATVPPHVSIADGVDAMGAAEVTTLAITDDGSSEGRLQALVTARDLGPVFGDHPATLLRDIGGARTTAELGALNCRARAFALEHLSHASAVDWLCRFIHRTDVAILGRLIDLAGAGGIAASWCFCGSSGRAELLTRLTPHVLLIVDDADQRSWPDMRGRAEHAYRRIIDAFGECDYLPRGDDPFETAFYVAGISEWTERFRGWLRDPVLQQMYRARALFDLRPVHGSNRLWRELETVVTGGVDRHFLHVLANDCLASLPPLTFFRDGVVGRDGDHASTFDLERSALRPLVDVGRVFGMAAGSVMGRSTLDRFATARRLLPEQDAIFREAAETLRVVLWQQGRVGISEGASGGTVPPGLLSRHDRQVLKGGFRSIHRLLEFTADPAWLETL